MGIHRSKFPPPNTNILRAKFVFDIKRGGEKYKARMVACGYTQVAGVDYFDTYASVRHCMVQNKQHMHGKNICQAYL